MCRYFYSDREHEKKFFVISFYIYIQFNEVKTVRNIVGTRLYIHFFPTGNSQKRITFNE